MKGLPVRIVAALCMTALVACSEEPARPAAGPQDEPGPSSFEQPFTDVAAYPIFVSSEIVVGENRFLVGILNDEDAPIGSPSMDVAIDFYDLEASSSEPVFSADTEFLRIDRFRGLYESTVEFDRPGDWGAEVSIVGDGIDETVRSSFEVLADPMTPALGERVPASDTPTASDVKSLSDISTDKPPIARYYQISIAEAVRKHLPFVAIFATPKFCQTAACAPMLDQTQGIADQHPDLTFIHVEPYDLDKVPELQPVDAALEWGLPSEPWVFVVDDRGRLVAKFEGVLSPDGLRAALEELL